MRLNETAMSVGLNMEYPNGKGYPGEGHRAQMEEVTHTQSISRVGLYLMTRENCRSEQILKITHPYRPDLSGINREYPAKVVRVDCLNDRKWSIAVEFL